MAENHGSGAHEWAIRTEAGRTNPGAPTVIENAEPIHFGLSGGKKRLAVSKRNRSGNNGEPQIEKICDGGDGSAYQHAGSANV